MKHRTCLLSRVLTLVLAVIMLVSVMSVGVNAATIKNVKHYDTYLCLGDSIAAGYGPYEGYEKIKGFERVDVAYHAIVADAVTADTFYPLARTGFRTHEIRYMLEKDYAGDDYLFYIANLKPDVVAQWKPVFEKAVKEADLITLNVGSNDVMNYAYVRAYVAGTADNTSELGKHIAESLANAGSYGEAIQKLLDTARSAGRVPAVVSAFVEGLFEGYQHFLENWDPLVKDIYDANPDATLVVAGLFNPMKTAKLTDASLLHIGRAFDVVAQSMNRYMQYYSPYARQYLYADMMDTETFQLDSLTNDDFGTTMIARVHPTEEGHQYMATQIIKLLPTQSEADTTPTPAPAPDPSEHPAKEFPFTDVKGGDWFYPDVYYAWDQGLMNGKSATTFDPNGTTTRAEFATVLYRLAGAPAVTEAQKKACPFKDLSAKWYQDAVVWAYDAKIVNGVSDTVFAPNAQITREQMVAMLYRYDGEKAAAGDLSKIRDADAISKYAKSAVAWAVAGGVVTGFPDGTFQPKGNATRAQMAAIIARFDRMEK